jgi:hypothetical protein
MGFIDFVLRVEEMLKITSKSIEQFLENISGLCGEKLATKMNVYVNYFDEKRALNSLEWTLPFWFGEREAVPTREAYKCKGCEYVNECPDKLIDR